MTLRAATSSVPAWLTLVAVAVLLAACAGPPRAPDTGDDADLTRCATLFADTDARVARAGVRDADSAPIADFPFLRINRLLASLGTLAADHGRAQQAWLTRLAALDADGRAMELRALEPRSAARRALRAELDHCRGVLAQQLTADAPSVTRLRAAAQVPDAYSRWQRAFGAYPLAALAARPGIQRLQREEMPRLADLRTPPSGARAYASPAGVARVTGALPRDALDVPMPEADTLTALLDAHAPTWIVDTVSDADRPGRLVREAATLRVDTTQPSVYTYSSFTRFDGRVLLQLNYVVWFSARPKSGPFDLLGGPLDGLTWRVTLDPDGRPLIYDTMHNCGCYHLWLPTSRLRARPAADDDAEPPWIAFTVDGGQRLALRLAAGTHYLREVGPAPSGGAEALTAYPYDVLRRLPAGHGRARSVFSADGLIHESQRLERWVLWPLGVPSAGAMRQRGHHATAFIGTRHFDDAMAIERYFERAGTR